MEIAGTFLMLLGLVVIGYIVTVWGLANPDSGLGKFVYSVWPWEPPRFIRERIERRKRVAQEHLEEATRPPDAESILYTTRTGDFIEILGRPIQYQAKMLFLELQFFDPYNKADKRHVNPRSGRTLREFLAVMLSGRRLLTEQPEGEGKSKSFFLYEDVAGDMPVGFTELMRGRETSPGPALRFAQSDQQAHVTFELLGKMWKCLDIVWADVQVEGGKAFVANGADGAMPRVSMLLSREYQDGDLGNEWLLFIDLRSGEGSDSLWRGRVFDPEAELDM